MANSTIPSQIQLPLAVALEVVLQGLRIRLGRSLVTLSGIILGVAFIMSVLTADLIRAGIASETAARQETTRMLGFLTAETGPLRDRTIAILASGKPLDAEIRLLHALEASGASALRWHGTTPPPSGLRTAVAVQSLDAAGQQASAVLLLGDGPPRADDAPAALASARQPVLATLRETLPDLPGNLAVRTLSLHRTPTREEILRTEAEALRNRARSTWILAISLFVTGICISNSLLMSVTERFKEIGTMKCLGALSSFIRRMYFLESGILGLLGSSGGALLGLLFAILLYSLTYGFGLVVAALNPGPVLLLLVLSISGGLLIAILAAIYPADYASRMVPATALRSNI